VADEERFRTGEGATRIDFERFLHLGRGGAGTGAMGGLEARGYVGEDTPEWAALGMVGLIRGYEGVEKGRGRKLLRSR